MFSKGEPDKEFILKGSPICPGIAIGRPFLFFCQEEHIPEFSVPKEQVDSEVNRYYTALNNSTQDLLHLQKRLLQQGGKEAAAVLASHLEIMRDPLLTSKVEEAIRGHKKNTEYVFKAVVGEYEKKFSKITDAFFQDRLKDFQDISRRIVNHLRNQKQGSLAELRVRSIVFAHDISPSEAAEANTQLVEAFVTKSGAETSHVAIMARAKGIPFVANIEFPEWISRTCLPRVIVDGSSGEVIINPTSETLHRFRQERKRQQIKMRRLQKKWHLPAETRDGHRIRLSANIESSNELDRLHLYGSEGIGLFRSEYLFLARNAFPSEEEQFLVYRTLAERIDGYPSVIRTFDIGGDKLGYVSAERQEKNPYLGCRAIRLMLKERTLFQTQIRAILRASAFGEVSILFPMISCLSELRQAKEVVERTQTHLRQAGIAFASTLRIGCMIEVPAAALIADLLIKECDFLSIGTNDLVQYSLAVDRTDPSMSYLYNPAHPSVMRMIKMVIEAGKQAEKPVSICGEIAGDPRFTSLLLGLGAKEFSISPPVIPTIKTVVRQLCFEKTTQLAAEVLNCFTPKEVETLLDTTYRTLLSHYE